MYVTLSPPEKETAGTGRTPCPYLDADMDQTTVLQHSSHLITEETKFYVPELSDVDPVLNACLGDPAAVRENPGRGLLWEQVLSAPKVSGAQVAAVKLPVWTPHCNVTNTGSLATARKDSHDVAEIGDETESLTMDGTVIAGDQIPARMKSLFHTQDTSDCGGSTVLSNGEGDRDGYDYGGKDYCGGGGC